MGQTEYSLVEKSVTEFGDVSSPAMSFWLQDFEMRAELCRAMACLTGH